MNFLSKLKNEVFNNIHDHSSDEEHSKPPSPLEKNLLSALKDEVFNSHHDHEQKNKEMKDFDSDSKSDDDDASHDDDNHTNDSHTHQRQRSVEVSKIIPELKNKIQSRISQIIKEKLETAIKDKLVQTSEKITNEAQKLIDPENNNTPKTANLPLDKNFLSILEDEVFNDEHDHAVPLETPAFDKSEDFKRNSELAGAQRQAEVVDILPRKLVVGVIPEEEDEEEYFKDDNQKQHSENPVQSNQISNNNNNHRTSNPNPSPSDLNPNSLEIFATIKLLEEINIDKEDLKQLLMLGNSDPNILPIIWLKIGDVIKELKKEYELELELLIADEQDISDKSRQIAELEAHLATVEKHMHNVKLKERELEKDYESVQSENQRLKDEVERLERIVEMAVSSLSDSNKRLMGLGQDNDMAFPAMDLRAGRGGSFFHFQDDASSTTLSNESSGNNNSNNNTEYEYYYPNYEDYTQKLLNQYGISSIDEFTELLKGTQNNKIISSNTDIEHTSSDFTSRNFVGHDHSTVLHESDSPSVTVSSKLQIVKENVESPRSLLMEEDQFAIDSRPSPEDNIIDSLPNIDLSARKLNFVSDSADQPLLDSKMNIYNDFPEDYDYGANPYIFSDDYTYLNDIMYEDNNFSEPQPMMDDIDLEIRESNLIIDSESTILETSAILPTENSESLPATSPILNQDQPENHDASPLEVDNSSHVTTQSTNQIQEIEKLQHILDEPELDSQKLFDEIVQIVEDRIQGQELVPEDGQNFGEFEEQDAEPESKPVMESDDSPALASIPTIISNQNNHPSTSQRPLRPATTIRDELKINHNLLPNDPNLLIQKLQRSEIFAEKRNRAISNEKSLFKDLIEDLIRFSLLIKSGWSDWTAYLFVKIL